MLVSSTWADQTQDPNGFEQCAVGSSTMRVGCWDLDVFGVIGSMSFQSILLKHFSQSVAMAACMTALIRLTCLHTVSCLVCVNVCALSGVGAQGRASQMCELCTRKCVHVVRVTLLWPTPHTGG